MEVVRYWRTSGPRYKMQGVTCEDGHISFPPRPVCLECNKKTNLGLPSFSSPDNKIVHSVIVRHNQEEYDKSQN